MSVYTHKKSSNALAPKPPTPSSGRAAFYDLDGTIVDLNLVHAAIFTLAYVGEWSGRVAYLLGFAARIPRLYVAERRDRRLLNTVLFEAFKGISRDRLLSLGEEYCERILIGHLFPHAVELIEANRAAGIEPVLVCSTQLRAALHRLLQAAAPRLPVLAYTELGAQLELDTIAVVNLGQPAAV